MAVIADQNKYQNGDQSFWGVGVYMGEAHIAQEGDRGKNEMCVKIKIAAASATRPERCNRRPKGMKPGV